MRRLLLLVGLAWGTSAVAGPIDERFDERRALATVEALDNYIRWPGNRHYDAAIDLVVAELEAAGFDKAADARLNYRIEEHPLAEPAWLPLSASLRIGDTELLTLDGNRNMLAINSHAADVEAALVDIGQRDPRSVGLDEVSGRIVLVDGDAAEAVDALVHPGGALGVLAYSMPDYLQPDVNRTAIQFRSIAYDAKRQPWAISLSTAARDALREALTEGPVTVSVKSEVEWRPDAVERTVVARIDGSRRDAGEFVFSAHLQEPGANDNASGVAGLLEMARVSASMLAAGDISPEWSLVFLWGDEFRATGRYVAGADRQRLLYGMSLDMIGNDTAKTGGRFLVEKMPDPSAIWQRGGERFSEWGGEAMRPSDMRPHFLNDLVLHYVRERAASTGWVTDSNPFEGGSDHVPFLDAGIPAVLMWHFTDQFYHTDLDRPDKVSATELEHVAVAALSTALHIVDPDADVVSSTLDIVRRAGLRRLARETAINREDAALTADAEALLIRLWLDWYRGAIESVAELADDPASAALEKQLDAAFRELESSVAVPD